VLATPASSRVIFESSWSIRHLRQPAHLEAVAFDVLGDQFLKLLNVRLLLSLGSPPKRLQIFPAIRI
jgi:hypothetical protein